MPDVRPCRAAAGAGGAQLRNLRWCATTSSSPATPGARKRTSWRGTSIRQSPHLGDEFRAYIFANQTAIYKANLREWADKFAAAHHTALPAFYDPTGALRAKVEADTQLGQGRASASLHTPTIYVVTDSPQEPFVEVTDQTKLFETIEQVKASLPPEPAAKKTKAKK